MEVFFTIEIDALQKTYSAFPAVKLDTFHEYVAPRKRSKLAPQHMILSFQASLWGFPSAKQGHTQPQKKGADTIPTSFLMWGGFA